MQSVITYFIGTAWAKLTPSPSRFRNRHVQRVAQFLQFGQPFGIKEHTIATFLSSSSTNSMSAINVFAVERLFFDISRPAWVVLLTVFSSTFCGLALAGVFRWFAVNPSDAVWWGLLPSVTLFQKLHFGSSVASNPDAGSNSADSSKSENGSGVGSSSDSNTNSKDSSNGTTTHTAVDKAALKTFGIVTIATSIWQVFPTYIMPLLTSVSIPCLATIGSPSATRKIVSTIFGGASANQGMGMLSLSLDWNLIGSWTLTYPLRTQLSIWLGIFASTLILPVAYYSNAFNARHLPFLSHSLFLSNGTAFHPSSISDSHGVVDRTKLDAVGGLPSMTATSALASAGWNMSSGAIPVHVLLFHGKDILRSWRKNRKGAEDDPHYEAMRKYPEVPMRWYGGIFGATVLAGLAVNVWGATSLPISGYLISLVTAMFMTPLLCYMASVFGFYVIGAWADMLAGALYPGRPLASLYFANWSTSLMGVAVRQCQHLKLAQYIKIPFRQMLLAQIYGAILGSVVYYPLMVTVIANQKEILLDPIGNRIWSGAYFQKDLASLVTWSLAADMYGIRGKYPIISLAFAIGACLPILHKIITKVIPATRKWQVNTAILAGMCLHTPFGLAAGDWTGMAVGFVSQVYLRRWRPRTYIKYNFLIGAALDGGAAITLFVLTMAVFGVFGSSFLFPTWWGNPEGPADHCVKTN